MTKTEKYNEEFNKVEAIYQKINDEIYELEKKRDELGKIMDTLQDKINEGEEFNND